VELISASLFSESLGSRKFRKDSPQRHRLHSKADAAIGREETVHEITPKDTNDVFVSVRVVSWIAWIVSGSINILLENENLPPCYTEDPQRHLQLKSLIW
jgi:hypothetical protein